MHMRAIQICSGLGAGNLGDEFMVRAFWRALPSRVQLCVEHFALFPRHYGSYPVVHAYAPVSLEDGTGGFQPTAPGLLAGTTPVSEQLGLQWPLQFLAPRLAAFHERRLAVDALGVGVEPLSSPDSIHIFQCWFAPLRSWTVRSERCRDALLELGVAPERIAVGADWAWLYEPEAESAASGVDTWRSLGVRLDEPLIVVNVVNEIWARHHQMKRAMAAALDVLAAQDGLQIAFFCQDIRRGPFYDLAAVHDVRAQMRSPSVVVPSQAYLPTEVLGILAHASLTLGQRYHFLLASVLADVPPLAIVRQPKVESLVEDLDLAAAGHIETVSADGLVEAARHLLRNRTSVRAHLRARRRHLRERARMNLQFFSELAAS